VNKSSIVTTLFVVAAVGAFVLIRTCCFIISEREQAVVTRFNKPVRVIVGNIAGESLDTLRQAVLNTAARTEGETLNMDTESLQVNAGAGLYFKMPFVDVVERFPDTIQEYDAEPEELLLADKKVLTVDNFAWWRIRNPLLFRVRVRTEAAARGVLDDVIYSAVRAELGQNDLMEVIRTTNEYVSPDRVPEQAEDDLVVVPTAPTRQEEIQRGREDILETVTRRSNDAALSQYGIEILAVRIKRADLVPENLQAIFARMEAERERISKTYLSEGEKEANILRSETDREVSVLMANAGRDAQIVRGEADARVVRIFADAFNRDPALYRYLKSLEVLREATPAGSEFILDANSGLLKALRGD
jgi:membrane protease subunit HflC